MMVGDVTEHVVQQIEVVHENLFVLVLDRNGLEFVPGDILASWIGMLPGTVMYVYNRRLVDNVHPSDWQNPTPNGKYNLVAIGAGTAGLISAIGTAGLGERMQRAIRNAF